MKMGGDARSKKTRNFLKFFCRKQKDSSNSTHSSSSQKLLVSSNSKNSENSKNATPTALPQEIHDYILQSLRQLHQDKKHPTCSTCLSRDFSSYSLVCKNWHQSAIPHMYENICINGSEHSAHGKKSKRSQKETSRSAKLLRTLTARPDYAAHIKVIKLPQINRESLPRIEVLEYLELAASIVKQCPNLEKVLGLYTNHGGWSNALNQALSTRSSLREQVFIFEDHVEKEELPPLQKSSQFTQLFEQWVNLETLVLCGVDLAPEVDFVGAFKRLPKLRRLMISDFEFGKSGTLPLQAIPSSVQDLRLENIHGFEDSALVLLGKTLSMTSIYSLSLVNIRIGRIQTLNSLFKIASLRRLTIADNQDVTYFDDEEEFKIEDSMKLAANFKSESLRYLHWDVLCNAAVEKALADAISSGFLPSLRLLRAPSDKIGVLQAVCKPLEGIALPGDYVFEASPQSARAPSSRMATAHSNHPPLVPFANSVPHSRRASISSRRASFSSYRSSTFSSTCSNQSSSSTGTAYTALTVPIQPLRPLGKSTSKIQPFPRSLPSARLRAQKRIDRSRQDIKLQIVIEDTDTKSKETISLRGFIGDIRSNVLYSLKPDIKTLGMEAGEHGDALVRFHRDVVDREWKRECMITPAGANEICTGSWNVREVTLGKGKKEKCVGAHVERRKVEYDTVTIGDLFV